MLEGIKISADQLGKGLTEFISDREKLTSAAVTVSAIALGIYTARVSLRKATEWGVLSLVDGGSGGSSVERSPVELWPGWGG